MDPGDEQPDDHCHRGRDIGGYKGIGCQAIGRQGAAAVEAKPSEPEQAGAQGHIGDIMW